MAATTTSIGEPKRKSARCLFGRPEPGQQITRQLTERTDRIIREESRKWNFDFNGGVPIVGADGDYQFEEVSAADVPVFYRDHSLRSRKAMRRRDSTPISDTVASPEELHEQLLLVDDPEPTLLVASTSNQVGNYEKPVTRSSTKKTGEQQDAYTLKQTKLTNYMPIRKRRSEVNLLSVGSSTSMSRSVSIDSEIVSQKDKRASGICKNKGAPKRPLRYVPSNIPKSSVSDSALVTSPRSPPAKKVPVGTRRAPRRNVGAGDF